MPTAVPVPTVDLLIKELKEVTAWYVFGASLRIPISQLESIKLNNASEGLEKQKTRMFHFWLQFNANASWKEIVRVLELNDLFTLAEKVKRKYVLHVASSSSTSQDQGMTVFSFVTVKLSCHGAIQPQQRMKSSVMNGCFIIGRSLCDNIFT